MILIHRQAFWKSGEIGIETVPSGCETPRPFEDGLLS